MSCYFRHLDDVFAAVGIVLTKQNRAQVNATVVAALGKELSDCPDTWREVKAALGSDEAAFLGRLGDAWRAGAE